MCDESCLNGRQDSHAIRKFKQAAFRKLGCLDFSMKLNEKPVPSYHNAAWNILNARSSLAARVHMTV